MPPRNAFPFRWIDAVLAASLLASFFLMPWLSFLGSPVAAHGIRETLRGPHRLVSAFARDTQVSFDYSMSLYLWVLPALASLVLVLALLKRDRAWPGLVAGLAALGAFWFLRAELRSYPFQSLEEGAYLALWSGIGLVAVAAARLAYALRRG